MQEVYFPLRSNGSWFTSDSARSELERRIKLCALLYDRVAFENARYRLMVWENGNLGFHMPAGTIPDDRSEISYYSPGDHFAFKVSATPDGEYHPLFDGPVIAAFEIDFYPILSDAGLLDADFIAPLDISLSDTGKAELKSRTDPDLEEGSVVDQLSGSLFQRKAIIEGVHHDSIVAFDLRMPFAADPVAASFISRKNAALAVDSWSQVLNPSIFASVVDVAFPDFSSLEWNDLVKIRESSAGRDLRDMIERLSRRLTEALGDPEGSAEVAEIARGLFIEELVAELTRYAPNVPNAVLGLATNLIPLAGWATSSAEAVKTLQHHQSWLSLLKRPPAA